MTEKVSIAHRLQGVLSCGTFLVLSLAVLAMGLADSAQARSLLNGDFETIDEGGTFGYWWGDATTSIESASVIEGAYSLECDLTAGIDQAYGAYDEGHQLDHTMSLDFATFATDGSNDRPLQMGFGIGLGEYATFTNSVYILGKVADENGVDVFQVYNKPTKQWHTIAAVNTTVDTGTALVWDGETPVVNTLAITTHWGEEEQTYDITVNDTTLTGLEYYYRSYSSTPIPWGETGQRFRLNLKRQDTADSCALYDNVVAEVPEPGTLCLLFAGLVSLIACHLKKRT